MTPFPNKKYEIIYADPPWSYSAGGKKKKCKTPLSNDETGRNIFFAGVSNCSGKLQFVSMGDFSEYLFSLKDNRAVGIYL